jgi:zinc D-Ala-D-Ala carboxypeptidase
MSRRRWVLAGSIWTLAAVVAAGGGLLIGRTVLDGRDTHGTPPQPGAVQSAPASQPSLASGSLTAPAVPSPQPQVTVQAARPVPGSDGLVLCAGKSAETVKPAADGTLLGHLPYAEAAASVLAPAPSGFGSGSCRTMHREARAALDAMLAAARAEDPALADAMVGLSCFRSTQYQKEVFCRKVDDGLAARARSSAPPGFSEHATGYAIDFGDRNAPGCNLDACFAETAVGKWLAANAPAYGFALSFPQGNAQGVMYEPWHWRFQASTTAGSVFAQAR